MTHLSSSMTCQSQMLHTSILNGAAAVPSCHISSVILLELPVTATQDYSLFNILNDYSTNLWEQQIQLIMEKHGLMSFVIHPDYVMGAREHRVFEGLLNLLVGLRDRSRVWITTPGEVNHWWRQRAQMQLVRDGDGWKIEGEGKERAVLAFAREADGKLAVTLDLPIKST